MVPVNRVTSGGMLRAKRGLQSGLVCALLMLCGSHAESQVETPAQSDQVVDSIGINVHLGYTDTLYYNNFPLIQSALAELGVRHVRDSAPLAAPPGFYANHSALLADGIHGEFGVQITDQASDIAGYPSLFAPGYFEAYEPPDECDVSSLCGTPWVSNLLAFLPTLQANSGPYPVLGPSFASPLGPPLLGNVSAYTGIGNMHNYKGGWNPGFAGSWGYGYVNYLSDALAIQLAGITNPGQPVMSTETGYTNATAPHSTQLGYPTGTDEPYDANSITEGDAAIYMPRVPLIAWIDGIQRTYIYELLSSPGEDYGLLRGDGSVKPAFESLEKLIHFLEDPGPPFQVQPLAYTISGEVPTMQHLLVERRSGKYYLFLWLETPIYDKFLNAPINVAPVNVQITTALPMTTAAEQVWVSAGSVKKVDLTPGVLNVSVGPSITAVILTVAQSPPVPQ